MTRIQLPLGGINKNAARYSVKGDRSSWQNMASKTTKSYLKQLNMIPKSTKPVNVIAKSSKAASAPRTNESTKSVAEQSAKSLLTDLKDLIVGKCKVLKKQINKAFNKLKSR